MDVILDIISRLVNFAFEFTCIPLFSDAMFRRGFFVALIGGFVIGKLSAKLLYWRSLIFAFFQPSAIPVPTSRPGPSGVDRARGCVSGVAMLILAAIVFFACAAALLMTLARGGASP